MNKIKKMEQKNILSPARTRVSRLQSMKHSNFVGDQSGAIAFSPNNKDILSDDSV